ncbi:MAG: glycoside hydrolase family 28 protein, partial [Bacteroidales bacterium]|nr:glycoside hydrolase family 28 protein [Bacteroidales bacterium]
AGTGGVPVTGGRDIYSGLPFRMDSVREPSIPPRTVSITDFGGVGDGVTLNTKAFSDAVEHLSSLGGGHLDVPDGIWFTGPVRLKNNIDLHISEGAIVVFSSDRDLYPIVNTSFEGLDTRRCESPISAVNAKNISITGTGVIDGGGENWRSVKKSKMTSSEWKKLVASGGVVNEKKNVWYPDEGYRDAERNAEMNVPRRLVTDSEWNAAKSFLRPVMISFRNCENVMLRDVSLQNSPCWTIHPLMCKNVIIDGIKVRNASYAQNSDGIDIESCENVVLLNSAFDVGDDGICIKSGKDGDGRRRGTPCRNVIVSGCSVYHGHGGFVVGSEMSGGVENVKVSDCRFMGTDVGLRFKSKRGRGGVVKNIYADRIVMTGIVTDAILVDLFYGGVSASEAAEMKTGKNGDNHVKAKIPPVDETTPEFRDIHISNVVCRGAARAIYFDGLPEMPIRNITLENVCITSERGAELKYCDGVSFRSVDIRPAEGEALTKDNVDNLKIR